MAVDMFMKIKDIDGESKDHAHKDEIDVLAWSWGVSNPGSALQGGGGRGGARAAFQDLTFSKRIDLASVKLALACAEGKHIDEAVLTCRKSGDRQPVDYLTITLKKVIVTSVNAGGPDGEDDDAEAVTLNYQTVFWKFVEQTAEGGPGRVVEAGYDLKAGKKV